jgi:hypothetical protein
VQVVSVHTVDATPCLCFWTDSRRYACPAKIAAKCVQDALESVHVWPLLPVACFLHEYCMDKQSPGLCLLRSYCGGNEVSAAWLLLALLWLLCFLVLRAGSW